MNHPTKQLSGFCSFALRAVFVAATITGVIRTTNAADKPTAVDKPNVLFISIDDLNDWLGCYGGHPQVKTPHIDALAKRGVLFSNAHCQAPICNPSRVSMLLGQRPSTTGMYFLGPRFRTVEPTKKAETIFQTFRKHGYFTSTKGKIFHGNADPASFDHIERTTGWRRGASKIHYTLKGSHPLWDWGQVDVPDEDQRDYHTADWAVKELPKLAASDQPFFLSVGFFLPHVPIYASKKWFDLYPLDSVQLPETTSGDRDDLPEIAKQLTDNPTAPRHQWMVENDQSKHAVRAYLAANSFVDSLVGRIIAALDASGEADNTVVVLWSDHGFHLGEKQRWAKRTLWEETTRVPLIVSGPGVSEGTQCKRPVELLDLYPTLLDLCDLPQRDELEGVSLRPLLQNPAAKWERPALCTFGPNNHSLRGDRFRYTIYADGSQELYDHQNDPNEWSNLVAPDGTASPEHRAVVNDMKQWLPLKNVAPVPGSAGSDSPLYGEGGNISLGEAMQKAK
ncbi:sulfatase [Stieleria marina]|uniref:Choline-sulfatase n=1 Tax=Stieleria marina TaxID=1930275 RepID=A0A517P1C6_9BACT|nr:Choline-sulfatase [Planctomycetes bacterium K23_9]